MKKALICVVGMLVLATAAWSQSTEKAVAALENQWLQSQKSNNVDLLIPLLGREVHQHLERRQGHRQV